MFLALDRLEIRYPGAAPGVRPAVDAVSLQLARGEIGVLIGPSGCGKTSLLRAVAGLETLSAGRVTVDGDVLADAQTRRHVLPERRRIGMVFQDYALFPHLSVERNLAFGIADLPAAERRERVQQMLALVGLAGLGGRAPHELSGGQQQRVALARALVPQPRLLLLDEPFSSLDIELRERLAQELRTILQQAGTTALFVTHDQQEAFALADRVGVMSQGRLHQWDAPYAVYHRPATRFVADFVGQGVFTAGRVLDAQEAACIAVRSAQVRSAATLGPAGAMPQVAADRQPADRRPPRGPAVAVQTALGLLHDRAGRALQAGPDGRCDVLLRADDIVHDEASPVRACIERKLFRGAEFLYTLRLATGERLLALVPSHHDHQVGEWIGIRAETDHVVTFEATPRDGGAPSAQG